MHIKISERAQANDLTMQLKNGILKENYTLLTWKTSQKLINVQIHANPEANLKRYKQLNRPK